jgi:hypothetical protein
MTYCAFDIETAATEDLSQSIPIHLSAIQCLGYVPIFLPKQTDHLFRSRSMSMDEDEASELVSALKKISSSILTWNGLSFDFRQLSLASKSKQACIDLALDHIDIMFQFHCIKGYPISLNAALVGMGISPTYKYNQIEIRGDMIEDLLKIYVLTEDAKSEEDMGLFLDARDRLNYILQNTLEPIETVKIIDRPFEESVAYINSITPDALRISKDYLARDVQALLELAVEIEARGGILSWVTKRGHVNSANIGSLKSVRDCLSLPEPNIDWMDNPISREDLMSWIVT